MPIPPVYNENLCLFGQDINNCSFQCHCGDGTKPEVCDRYTGECSSGECGYSGNIQWSGVGCQTGNIGYGKQVNLIDDSNTVLHSGTDLLSNTVTNDNTCGSEFRNLAESESRWVISLGQEMRISSMVITLSPETVTTLSNYECIVKMGTGKRNCRRLVFNQLTQNAPFPTIFGGDCSRSISNEELVIEFVRCNFNSTYPQSEVLELCAIEIVGFPNVGIDCNQCQQNIDSDQCGNGAWCEVCSFLLLNTHHQRTIFLNV